MTISANVPTTFLLSMATNNVPWFPIIPYNSSPEREGYEFLYFETDDGQKIYDNKLHIDDKDYYIKAVYSKIPTISLPQTGEDNHGRLIALYGILVLMAFGTADFFLSKRDKKNKN